MPKGRSNEDTTMLSMALLGYESEKQRIEQKIEELRAHLNGSGSVSSASSRKASVSAPESSSEGPKRRTLSAAARKRIAAAQKKRWAEHRKRAASAAKE